MSQSNFLNRKSIEILSRKEVSPIQKRYTKILEEREEKRKNLRQLMELEKMIRDPENIKPTFQPVISSGRPNKSKLTKAELEKFLLTNKIWQQRKEERIK